MSFVKRILSSLAEKLTFRRGPASHHDDAASYAELPRAFREREHKIIRQRRCEVGKTSEANPLPDELVGLALSGGSVRGATFCLGVLQALATHHVLRAVDYLSTVSGGGYIGAFLGRFFTRFLNRPTGAADVIEARLRDVNSPEIAWLRRSSEYLAATGIGEAPVTRAVMLRGFLTVHCLAGVLLVAAFGIANLFRYVLLPPVIDTVNPILANVTRLSAPIQLPDPDPWLFLLIVATVIGLLPLAIAFWLPSESPRESYRPWMLLAFFVASSTVFLLALAVGAWFVAAAVFVTTIGVFFWTELAWHRVRRSVPGATTHPSGRAMVLAKFSKWLAVAVSVAALLFFVWMLDRMVFEFYEGVSWRDAVQVSALWCIALLLPLRWLARRMFAGATRGFERVLTNPFLLAVLLGVPLLVGWNFVSHAMFQGGAGVERGIAWTAAALLMSAFIGGHGGIALVNQSSLHSLSAARGARAYLGASNPYRHATEMGADITSPQPEDDLAFDQYAPHRSGGPVHIINVFAKQSLDRASGRRTRGQKGENMAISPVGVSLGPTSHAMWVEQEGSNTPTADLNPFDTGDLPDSFVRRANPRRKRWSAILQTTSLRLSDWMLISGATLTPGPYSDTRLGTSLLYGLANVRTGFWWDSGIEDGDRAGEPVPSVWKRIERFFLRRVRAQRLLLAEFTGRFAGPWQRYWYLSDGGHADDLAIYELVRRRVPMIICADATRDGDGGLASLANAMRKVRVDLGARIEFLSTSQLNDVVVKVAAAGGRVPQSVINAIGPLDDVRCQLNGDSRRHAAIARVRYEGADVQSVLLYVKATMTGDEPVEVLEYRRQHPRFPHQSVLNQYLDDPQWESYRELGLHSASPLFSDGLRWLADVRNVLLEAQDASKTRV
jgi:hypothetical protein